MDASTLFLLLFSPGGMSSVSFRERMDSSCLGAIDIIVIDLGVEYDIIKKSGSWFSYGEHKLAQGREAVKQLLSDNVELCDEIEAKIREVLEKVQGM